MCVCGPGFPFHPAQASQDASFVTLLVEDSPGAAPPANCVVSFLSIGVLLIG